MKHKNLFLGILYASCLTLSACNFSLLLNPSAIKIELQFKISGKDENGEPVTGFVFDDDTAAKEIANVMKKRISNLGYINYQVKIDSFDTIKVTFYGYDYERDLAIHYLSYDGGLAISNSKDNFAFGKDFLSPNNKAYMDTTGSYPSIVIPIDKESESFKRVYYEAKEMSDNGEGEVVEEYDGDDEEEHSIVCHAYLYLWYNYIPEYYSYDKIDSNSSSYDVNIASKVLMTFDAACPFQDEKQDALRTYISPSNNDVFPSQDEIIRCIRLAKYYVNIINAGELDYCITYLSETSIN